MLRKGSVLLLVLFTGMGFAVAQQVNNCGFKIPPRSALRSNFQSVYEAQEIVKNMLDTIRWKENFRLKEENGINNAYATVIRNIRWIIYDNNFLENLDQYASTKWASISVIAHEIGHHYYNHVVSGTGSTPPKEIQADEFSGYVMGKLGATLQQSVAAMQAIASDKASASHPAKKDRIAAITKGWNSAGVSGGNTGQGNTGNTGGNPGNSGNPDLNTDPNTDPSWIALSMQNTQTEVVYLSDDGKKFQPVEMKPGEPFVFKFEIYPYGWLRLRYYNGYRTYKLLHGKDYNILWNRRTKNWVVVEVPS
jgi:hypothetical protein